MRDTRSSRLVGSVLVALVALALAAAPASAKAAPGRAGPPVGAVALTGLPAIGGVTIVSARSDADSTSPKSAYVSCPDGKVPVGTGASIGYTNDEVHVTGIVPSSYTDGGSVRAYASEDDNGYGANWYLKVTAVCATPPPGYEIIEGEALATDGPDDLQGANCSPGKDILGGGAWLRTPPVGGNATLPDVILTFAAPSSSGSSFTAAASEDLDGTTTTWVLDVFAICSNPIRGWQYVVDGGLNTALGDDERSETVVCPAGTSVLSAGGFIDPGDSEDGRIAFTSIAPSVYGDSHFVTVEAALTSDEPRADTWGILAIAVCATVMTPTRF